MSNTNEGGCLPIVGFILYAVVIIGSGILSWNWIEPKSFVGAIGFMILWGILSYIGYLILIGIITLLSEK
ncbi:hypothetical protein [Chryseobacterium sediminis]|uniref:Uncharacterized protein n=1 Tax=Chryseobacterium sediminis TaxID=1679494 RepID=A0A5B2UBX0_9FLAO|nr:hypothetical protein [Chryseobacterium sediminis]KAA2224006.1 hypothetical protein FW780_07360 [Chryseobacterium sediminis]